MLFKHPEILFALFLLVIPIIVHLFQLRKFKKTPFTNVAFLKKVILQTRKSSQLKKWLTLLARLLALACVIFAFAQPFLPKSDTALQPKETIVYLDNSFSMQLEGKRGELLKRAIHEILETLPPEKTITLMTNDEIYRNVSVEQLKKELLQLPYSSNSIALNTILLRAKNEFSKNPGIQKMFVGISDFQGNSIDLETISSQSTNLGLIQLQPVNTNNISIDSVYISEETLDKFTLAAVVSYSGEKPATVPVSLYSDEKLIAKTSAGFDQNATSTVNLTVNKTSETINGKIQVEDDGLEYDNSFFFSIQQPEKIKVVALSNGKNDFLNRIYDPENFDFVAFENGKFDYNKIASANTVILNGLEEIPSALVPILSQLTDNGGHLVVIPSTKSNLQSYNLLLQALQAPIFSNLTKEEKSIVKIVFAHPLYGSVFEDRVENFQYPSVQSAYKLNGNAQSILKFSDGEPFLAQAGNVYIFTAGLTSENSNFKNSPLIVPTFYNLAEQSLPLPELYYTIGKKSVYSVKAALQKDEIVSIENEKSSFVPLQQHTENRVQITTESLPKKAGIYQITNNNRVLQNVAYNYDRAESELNYANLEQLNEVSLSNDVASFFSQQQEQNEIDELWKWFVIFAVFFLLVEILLLNYLK
ncbi:MAG TPA: BatA domain-containing protein [Flavobacteriaceae bacterium]|nr:BatA domain-containing protein [Flavobacteriaceae bacterium]